jgi:Glyoxalase/Bleomycin resistance protein/Dioxygenase superfamily.
MIKINHLMHTGLIISDLEKSRAFYEGLLGFKPNPTVRISASRGCGTTSRPTRCT